MGIKICVCSSPILIFNKFLNQNPIKNFPDIQIVVRRILITGRFVTYWAPYSDIVPLRRYSVWEVLSPPSYGQSRYRVRKVLTSWQSFLLHTNCNGTGAVKENVKKLLLLRVRYQGSTVRPIHMLRSRTPAGVRCAHFPSVITTIMDQKL
jgi:hypothetical protein